MFLYYKHKNSDKVVIIKNSAPVILMNLVLNILYPIYLYIKLFQYEINILLKQDKD